MKTKLLLIIAILIVLFPLVPLVQYNIGNQVMVNGMTVSGSTVLLVSIGFSAFSWFLFAWASKSIKVEGILLSIISSAVLMIPFYDVLGPMASVIIGLVAGFVAFMFHKHMITRDNKSLIITIATVAVSYLALTIMIVLVTFSSVSDGNGIGEWSGTADGMERNVRVFGVSFNIDSMSTGNPNECYYRNPDGTMSPCGLDHHGGSIDLDPDLSPSYALDFMGSLFYHTLLPLVGLGLGISASFLVPHFILKRKKIPSKPYLSLILAGLLLYFFIPHFVASLHTFTIIFSQPEQIPTWVFNPRFVLLLIPIIVCVIPGIILYKSPVIRKLIRK